MVAPAKLEHLRVAVVGASLGGLSVANVVHKLGAKVAVFELFPEGFHNRGGALGAVDIGLVQQIRGGASPRVIRGHGHFYGDLWQHLYEGLPAGTVSFGIDISSVVDPESDTPRLLIGDATREFDLIIGADGGKSSLRSFVTSKLPVYAGYTVWRGLVPVGLAPGPPSGRATVGGVNYETLGFPCAGPEGTGDLWKCGVYMPMPESEVLPPSRNRQVAGDNAMKTVPAWVRKHSRPRLLPVSAPTTPVSHATTATSVATTPSFLSQFVPLVRELFAAKNEAFWAACVANGKVASHPVWELAADRVVKGRVLLLGDAAHMASPRTGAGAYTAMVKLYSMV